MRDTAAAARANPVSGAAPRRLDTLQINVGYRCNQSCFHCHVNAGPEPHRGDDGEVADTVLAFVARRRVATLDITGGAPELNAHFRRLVRGARALGTRVMDRCNLTDPGAAGPGRPGGVPRRQPRRGGRLDAVLSAGQCRAPARQGRVRRLDPRPEEAQRARLWARPAPDRSTSSTIRKGRRCRRRKPRSKPTTSACSASATASCSTSSSCSPTCRSSASAPCW